MKLTPDEIRSADRVVGELFIDRTSAVLCGGGRPTEWPEHGHLLPPLYSPRVTRLRGDDFIVAGEVLRDAIHIHAGYAQAWWCGPAPDSSDDLKRDAFIAAQDYVKPGRTRR